MNKFSTKKFKMIFAFICSIAICGYVLAKDPDAETRRDYFKQAIEGEVKLQASKNEILRDCSATNAFTTLTTKGYHLRSSSVVGSKGLKNMPVKILEYGTESKDLSQKFRVSIVESKNGRDEAMNGLVYLMSSSSNMGGIRFKQLKDGPGDVCFVNKMAEPVTNAFGISVLFFCRDNIAVMVVPYSLNSNILSFARLIDSSIMMTSGKNQRVGNNEVMSQQSTNEIATNNLVVSQSSTNAFTK